MEENSLFETACVNEPLKVIPLVYSTVIGNHSKKSNQHRILLTQKQDVKNFFAIVANFIEDNFFDYFIALSSARVPQWQKVIKNLLGYFVVAAQ